MQKHRIALQCGVFVVPENGLEPSRSCLQGILSPRCLPFHHSGMGNILPPISFAVKQSMSEKGTPLFRLFVSKSTNSFVGDGAPYVC